MRDSVPTKSQAMTEAKVCRPAREQAEAAVRTLIAYVGDDPTREAVLETPKRIVEAYDELYRGYREDPLDVLNRAFGETAGYDDFVW